MAPPSRMEGFREGRGWGRIPPVLLHGGSPAKGEKMRTLYKYYKSLPNNYLLNPTLKLACPENLNDPFENSISDLISKIPEVSDNSLSYFKKVVNHAGLSSALSNTGVVSMSETHRNLLMWAHYADEHRGLVIGYREDILTNKFRDSIFKFHGISKTPLKVDYDTVRFDSESEVKTSNNHKKILKKILTTKGDDWIYEKEHRFLIPIYLADSIVPNKKHDELMKDYINNNAINKTNDGFNFKHRFTEEQYTIGWLESETNLLRKTSCSFYIEVNPMYISSIYFGCRCPEHLKNIWGELIENNREHLSHIKLYEYKISETDFSLICQPYKIK